MLHRLIGLATAGALVAAMSTSARSVTLSPVIMTVGGLHASTVTSGAPATCPVASSAVQANGGLIFGSRSVPQSTSTQPLERFTTSTKVACVELKLTHRNVPADVGTSKLLIVAHDSSGAVIVGSGKYTDSVGNPVSIEIGDSEPGNTAISPTVFSGPTPNAHSVSNVANILYKGRAHFHFPTFTVANVNPKFAVVPAGGVTVTWYPAPQIVDLDPFEGCVSTFSSVGGNYYGGPFLPTSGCRLLGQPTDVLQIASSNAGTTYVTYQVNPNFDTSRIVLGFGSDKRVYFAYARTSDVSQTTFGFLTNPFAPTSTKVASGPRLMRAGMTGVLHAASAKITSVSSLTLGNDGNLWFSGSDSTGKPTIGRLSPFGGNNWGPTFFPLPDADQILSLEPGIGANEVMLYRLGKKLFIGTLDDNLKAFNRFEVLTSVDPASLTLGDLIAGPSGNFYISATTDKVNGIFRISSTGKVSPFCNNVNVVYRLSDDTGFGFRNLTNASAVVHLVPDAGCTQVPDKGVVPEGPTFYEFLTGVDSTTPDWIFWSFPNGHRGGIF